MLFREPNGERAARPTDFLPGQFVAVYATLDVVALSAHARLACTQTRVNDRRREEDGRDAEERGDEHAPHWSDEGCQGERGEEDGPAATDDTRFVSHTRARFTANT
ncbi:hypothetical protein GCM10009000_123180 [Halobacterium noricense]